MLVRGNVPILAVIIETLVFVGIIILTISAFRKYFERRKQPTLYLSFSFLAYALAVLSTGIGKWLQFIIEPVGLYFANGTILLAYVFTALANGFLFAFVNAVFLNWGSITVVIIGLLNGATAGIFVTTINFQVENYDQTLPLLIYHVVNTMLVMGFLMVSSFREVRKNTQQMPKVGFTLIGLYGVFILMVFVLFALDIFLPEVTGSDGYTPAYYAAWISAGIGVLCGYLGYIFPDWLKKFLKI